MLLKVFRITLTGGFDGLLVTPAASPAIFYLPMRALLFVAKRLRTSAWILFGLIVGSHSFGTYGADFTEFPIEDLRLFSEIFSRIKADYVEEIDDTQLLQAAIEGMLRGLDPHSAYLDPKTYAEIQIDTQGEFGGLGIEVIMEDDAIRVVAPMDGTPADRAGLLSGDRIIRLGDAFIQGMSIDEAVNMMRGEPGTEIRLLIVREEEAEPFEITLKRAVIRLDSVWSELLDEQFGYARVSQFQPGTAKELELQIASLVSKSIGGVSGLVLDLRNNPGGFLNSAVAVSDLFLNQGVIVTTRGRNKDSEVTYKATPTDILYGAPIVVIVNGGSASAAEIVAGALQDHKRGVIMGEKTFGKGSVQTILPMENGAALKLTTARYFTPSNRSIQAIGISPDVEGANISFTAENQNESFSLREKDLPGALASESADEDDKTPGQPLLPPDNQIRQAVNLLKSMVIASDYRDFIYDH